MSINMRGLLAGLAMVAGHWAAPAAHAFCIENYTTEKLSVVELIEDKDAKAKNFWIKKGMWTDVTSVAVPGDVARSWFKNNPNVPKGNPNAQPVPGTACCHWSNEDCNPSKRQHAFLHTQITVLGGGQNNLFCGQAVEGDYMAVKFVAGGRVQIWANPKFNANAGPSAKNPKYLAYVLNVEDVHIKTYPCPGAPRGATWMDLIPDWSDVVAG